MYSPTLVGRGEELELLLSAVSGPPAVVVVEGEAGVGKTRLVTELAARSEAADRTFVTGRCHRIREPFPLGPFVEALRELDEELGDADLSPVAGALRPVLPELAHVLPPSLEPLDDRAAERHRVFRGLTAVLASLGPAVVVIEDVHWADEQTIDFIGYLLSALPATLAVVLTFRGEEAGPDVRALTAKLPEPVGQTRLAVAPLDETQTGVLAAAALGMDSVSAEFGSYLWERSSGLPFVIQELLALLQARGTLVRRGGRWARRALDELDVPAGVRDPVLDHVGRLSGDAVAAVEAAAVLHTPSPAAVLVATCQAGESRARGGLDAALESGLLAEHGDLVGFRHALAAQAVYDTLPGPRRQDLHARAASALRRRDPAPLGQVAHHLRGADQPGAWVAAAEEAADQAIDLGHDTEAARLLEDVLRHAPVEPDQRDRLALKLARSASYGLRGREVLSLLFEMLGRGLPRTIRGELRTRLAALVGDTGGDPLLQRRLFVEAVEDLDDRPDLKAWAMVGLGVPTTPGVPGAEHSKWLHRILDVLSEIDDPAFEVFLRGKVAMVMVSFGDPEWRGLTDRIVEQTGGAPRHRREVNAYYSVGMEACCAGHHETSERLLTAGLECATGQESRRSELTLRAARALLSYCRGSWDGLDEENEILLDELTDLATARIDVAVSAGCLALARGDLDTAERRLADVVERAEELGAFDVLPLTLGASTRLAMAHGDVDAALSGVRRFVSVLEPKGIWAPITRALPPMTQALTTAGEVSEARALADRFGREVREVDAPLAPPALLHARGFLDTATERWPAAARHFLAAAGLYEPLHCPYEAAQAREQAALALFAAEDPEADQALLAAEDAYRRLGATWDLDRAAATARRHGVSLPARHRGGARGYGADLSPREWKVAELASTGRTNGEIAAELFVSVKTVDKHLSAALRKLGVRSRTALARRFGGVTERAGDKTGEFSP